MKKTLIFSILLLSQAPCFAIKPVQGSYAGVFLGPTYTSNIEFTFNPTTTFNTTLRSAFTDYITSITGSAPNLSTNTSGELTYSVLGGVGGEIGYRFCDKFRLEFEVLYNNNPFSELKLGENIVIDSVSTNPRLHIEGDTNTGAGIINFYYDFLTRSRDGYSAIAPYVAVGVGYYYSQNTLIFNYGENTQAQIDEGAEPATLYETKFTQAHSGLAGQAIVGVSYFMDDFTWLFADVRYLSLGTTSTINPVTQADFQRKTALYSIMIGFNGIMDFG
ncbi:MAG: outer membrane beta-barrel protein [Gammaproteobacteria bacterium]|nr:outer membrane beta-barrel protein [Gammaproteobacteria bacterium]